MITEMAKTLFVKCGILQESPVVDSDDESTDAIDEVVSADCPLLMANADCYNCIQVIGQANRLRDAFFRMVSDKQSAKRALRRSLMQLTRLRVVFDELAAQEYAAGPGGTGASGSGGTGGPSPSGGTGAFSVDLAAGSGGTGATWGGTGPSSSGCTGVSSGGVLRPTQAPVPEPRSAGNLKPKVLVPRPSQAPVKL